MVQSAVLGLALQKVRSLLQGDEVRFSPDEIKELYDYALPRLQDQATEDKERDSFEQIYAIVRDYWDRDVLGPVPEALRQRQQHGFRASLDKLLQERYGDVNNDDLAVLRAAYLRMAGMPTRADSHQRLMRIMAHGLARYRAYLDSAPDAAHPLPIELTSISETTAGEQEDAGEPATCRGTNELFEQATRVEITGIGPFPAVLRVRLCEVHGPHRLSGDLPEGCMLRVLDGGVHVEGMCHGHIHASGAIHIAGAAAEGWFYSEHGDITCERAMSSARLLAPEGRVITGHCEGISLALARDGVEIAGALHGGVVAARTITVSGDIAGAHIHCTGNIRAARVAPRGRAHTHVVLGRYIALDTFGATHRRSHDDLHANLRELHRSMLETQGLEIVAKIIREDLMHRMRAILFQVRVAGRTSHTLDQIRGQQQKATFLEGIAQVAGAFYCAALESLALPEDDMRRCIGNLADVTTRLLDRIEQELAQDTAMQNAEARGAVAQASRHVVSAMKKCREGLRMESSAIAPLDALHGRAAEFRQQASAAGKEFTAILDQFGREMGAFFEDKADALGKEVDEALQQAKERNAIDRETQSLADTIHRQRTRAKDAETQARNARQTLDGVRQTLANTGAILFPETWPPRAHLETEGLESGVLLALSPLCDPGSGMPLGHYLRIDAATAACTAFERKGDTVEPQPGQLE